MGSSGPTFAYCAATAASGNVNGLLAIITLHYMIDSREGQHLHLKLNPRQNPILQVISGFKEANKTSGEVQV